MHIRGSVVRGIWSPNFAPSASLFRLPSLVNSRNRGFHATASPQSLIAVVEPCYTALVAVHEAVGLPWAATISLTAVTLRSIFTTPLAVSQRLRAKKQSEIAPLITAMTPILRAQLAHEAAKGHADLKPEQIVVLAARERWKRRIALYRRYKVQNWKMLFLPAVQVPLFVAMSLTIRTVCGWTVIPGLEVVDGLEEASFLWCSSLVRPDPWGILPLSVGACALANVELLASKTKLPSTPSFPSALLNVSRAGCIFFMTMAFQAPAAIGIYWLTSNAYSLVLNMILNHFIPLAAKIDYSNVSQEILPLEQRSKEL